MLGKFFDKVKDGLARTRAAMTETIAAVVPLGTRLDDDAIDDIEAALIGADMGLETATEIVDELRDQLRDEQIADGPAGIMRILEEQVAGIVALDEGGALPLEGPLPGKPYVILIVGVNGAGKTTTAGKLAKRYADAGKKVVMAACDTFRAAAIPQLEIWAERANADLVRAQAGADPAAVAFDALAAAKSRGADVLLVDPPRAGLDARVREAILAARTPRVVYLSCNPATLARDLAQLGSAGYRLSALQAFDLFPQTPHVEALAELTLASART